MKEQTSIWVHLIWAITAIVCCLIIFSSLAWIFSPTDWNFVFRMEADDKIGKIIDTQVETIKAPRLDYIKPMNQTSCIIAGDCFVNNSLKGCQKQGINWCCTPERGLGGCTLLAEYKG